VGVATIFFAHTLCATTEKPPAVNPGYASEYSEFYTSHNSDLESDSIT
jgi:hypothetical protein